ncbi:unnamed protein product [Aphanomyces euteiches]|uniref:Uncharacterized protein n=1 Tax=Aphanomyces euteiches TaxID=100861 RepID=A0A6G0WZS2_9STRA|nr:hypothetical protein Ae201684_009846 [Aphanomyces euteiches]KAH9095961.1 hypothetical protein Ae201684P_010168 [Aphanomyces euteiches]KAH9156602.1 hypothetical protein AeRB84_001512 [Aphanomyces euteiches]
MESLEALRRSSLRYVLDVAPSMLRESEQVSDVLIERIRSQQESEEGVNAILRLMSLHLQSNARVTEQLVELLYTSDFRVSIIHHLPKLTYQSKPCMVLVIQAYRDLLETDGALVVPILGSLADMPLSPEQQNQVVDMTHALMDSIAEEDIPAVVRGLLAMLTSANADLVIGSIRTQCLQLATHTLLLVVEVMGRYLRSGSISLKYIMRAIRNTDTLMPIDGLWLLLLMQHDSKHAWSCMAQLGRKCSASWLESIAMVALESPETLLPLFTQFCMLIVQLAFQKSTLVGLRHDLIFVATQSVAFLLQHTRGLAQQEVLVTLLTLASQSHKITTTTKQADLRGHLARTAAVCIADNVAAIPSYGYLILDTVHHLSMAKEFLLNVVDPLCFGLVQLITQDPSLYSLVLLTIQKHILMPSNFQITAMLLSSHLSYAKQLEPMDQRAISKWMYRLFHTASPSVVPFICSFLCVQVERELCQILPALVRRRILTPKAPHTFSLDRFVRAENDAELSTEQLHALLDMTYTLVLHSDEHTLDALLASVPQVEECDDDGIRQCSLMIAIAICNGLDHIQLRVESIPKYFQLAYDLAKSLEMWPTLCFLQQDLVLGLSHALPIPSLHVLFLMLRQRPTDFRWQLYGTYTLHNPKKYLDHLPHWLDLIVDFGHHEKQPTHAETLLQLYSIFLQLLQEDSADNVIKALVPSAPSTEEARAQVFAVLKEQAMEQLQDAQAIVPLLDLLVVTAGSNPTLIGDTAYLAQAIYGHVFPDAALDLTLWKTYLDRPAASFHLTSTTFLKPPSPFASSTHYMYHAMVTAYALHPQPLQFLQGVLSTLQEMVDQAIDHCHPEVRSVTTDSFRFAFVSYWLCLLNFCPRGAQIPKQLDVRNPYIPCIQLFALLESSFAFLPRANEYDAEASFAQKTIVLMLRACQVVCEQMIKCVDRCLRWRVGVDISDDSGNVRHLSPLLYQMEFVLSAMEVYVQGMQRYALRQLKEAAKPTKTKLQQFVKKQRVVQPLPQIKFMPQVLRWIQRTKEAIAKTQTQYSIPPGSDMDLQELVQTQATFHQWNHHDSDEEEEKENESSPEDDEEYNPADDFHVMHTDVTALQTPQKALADNDSFGFPSIVIDFKQLKKK